MCHFKIRYHFLFGHPIPFLKRLLSSIVSVLLHRGGDIPQLSYNLEAELGYFRTYLKYGLHSVGDAVQEGRAPRNTLRTSEKS
jgi:hypothetical protein